MTNQADIKKRWQLLSPYLNREQQALWAAAEADIIGRGGFLALARIMGFAPQTISRRRRQVKQTENGVPGSIVPVRRPRPKRCTQSGIRDPDVIAALDLELRMEVARNPTGRKKCVRGSIGMLRRRLEDRGVCVEAKTVSVLMRRLGYTLKLTRGRKLTETKDPNIETALQSMVSEEIAGDPMGRQSWVRSSLRNLSSRLDEQGHKACTHTVARLLRKMGYSLQVVRSNGQEQRTQIVTNSLNTLPS